MAANVRPIEDLVVEQVQAVGGNAGAVENAKTFQAKVKKLDHGDEDGPAVGGKPPSYWIDLKDYNPAEHAKRLAVPMLILQGERDYQVPMKDFALFDEAASIPDHSCQATKTMPLSPVERVGSDWLSCDLG